MSIEAILKEAAESELETVVVTGLAKDGTMKLLAHPDNVLVANYLLARAQFELHLFEKTARGDVEPATPEQQEA